MRSRLRDILEIRGGDCEDGQTRGRWRGDREEVRLVVEGFAEFLMFPGVFCRV